MATGNTRNLFPSYTSLDVGFSPQSMHQQRQLQHQQFQKELEKIQLLQQQQMPFHPHGDLTQDPEFLDSSGLFSESSGTSSCSPSPRASNHSLHSSSSASKTGTNPSLEQDEEGKDSYIVSLSITWNAEHCVISGLTLFSPGFLHLKVSG